MGFVGFRFCALSAKTGRSNLRVAFSGNLSLRIGLVLTGAVCLAAAFAGAIIPIDPLKQDLGMKLLPPLIFPGGSAAHWLGTDDFGRDLLSRLLVGARISLFIAGTATLISGVAGVLLGLFAAYYGGMLDSVVMRLADIQLAFPPVLLAILVVAVLGNTIVNLVIVLAITNWVIFTRIVYSTVVALKGREFVSAAVAAGAPSRRVILRHILPNSWSPIIVIATLTIARTVLTEAALSFLGLGVPVPNPAWGSMLNDGRNYMWVTPWLATLPGVALVVTVFGINMLGDGLRQAMDPKLRGRGVARHTRGV